MFSLALIIIGAIFLLNQVTWFSGEDAVGLVLLVAGAVLLTIQVIAGLIARSHYKKISRRIDSRFR